MAQDHLKTHIAVESFEDGTVCVRFDCRGFRIPLDQAIDLLKKLETAIGEISDGVQ